MGSESSVTSRTTAKIHATVAKNIIFSQKESELLVSEFIFTVADLRKSYKISTVATTLTLILIPSLQSSLL